MVRVLEIARFIKTLGLPKFQAFLLYQMIGVSQLQFVAQLRSPPKALRRYEISAARAVIGGPGLWAPMELFYYLKATFHLPVAIQAFDTLCESVMLKVRLSMDTVWKQSICTLQEASRHDDACMDHPLKAWLQGCAVFNLRTICQRRATCELWSAYNMEVTSKTKTNACQLQRVIHQHLFLTMHPYDSIKELSKKFSR